MLRRTTDGYVPYTGLASGASWSTQGEHSVTSVERRQGDPRVDPHHPMWAMRERCYLLTLGTTVVRRSGDWSGARTGRDVRGARGRAARRLPLVPVGAIPQRAPVGHCARGLQR